MLILIYSITVTYFYFHVDVVVSTLFVEGLSIVKCVVCASVLISRLIRIDGCRRLRPCALDSVSVIKMAI